MNGAAVTNSTPARSPGTRAASFASLATGWAVATVAWIVRSVHGPGFGYVTDFAFMVAWPVVALVFAFVNWPVLERVPRRVRVGDPFEELADRYPRLFDTPTNAITGNSSAGGRAFTYRVEFDEVGGRVSAIEVERREAP